jgi:hypothetical protein
MIHSSSGCNLVGLGLSRLGLTDLTLSVFEIQGDSSAGPGDGCGTAAGDSEGGGGVGGGAENPRKWKVVPPSAWARSEQSTVGPPMEMAATAAFAVATAMATTKLGHQGTEQTGDGNG